MNFLVSFNFIPWVITLIFSLLQRYFKQIWFGNNLACYQADWALHNFFCGMLLRNVDDNNKMSKPCEAYKYKAEAESWQFFVEICVLSVRLFPHHLLIGFCLGVRNSSHYYQDHSDFHVKSSLASRCNRSEGFIILGTTILEYPSKSHKHSGRLFVENSIHEFLQMKQIFKSTVIQLHCVQLREQGKPVEWCRQHVIRPTPVTATSTVQAVWSFYSYAYFKLGGLFSGPWRRSLSWTITLRVPCGKISLRTIRSMVIWFWKA